MPIQKFPALAPQAQAASQAGELYLSPAPEKLRLSLQTQESKTLNPTALPNVPARNPISTPRTAIIHQNPESGPAAKRSASFDRQAPASKIVRSPI